MADGKWVMTEEDARRVDLSFGGESGLRLRDLPNFGRHRYVDDRGEAAKCGDPVGDSVKCGDLTGAGSIGKGAARVCAFCGSEELQGGFGCFGEGFGCKSFKCRRCGGTTDFVYKDEVGRFELSGE